MSALRRKRPRDPNSRRVVVRRAVVMMPNGLTLFNLFCGIYAIILALRGDIGAAPGFIVLGGIADTLDGRVARATGTGSRFGEELDSLVDAISFGFAPALIMYLGTPPDVRGNLDWLLVFIFTACAVMRLARFNVEQAGRKKTHFHGLPSPAAGLTLATYYWFSQTPLYRETVILFTDSTTLAQLPWHNLLRGLMAVLAALMISDVPYPAVPSIGFNSIKRIFGTLMIAGALVLLLVRREEFIFPALVAYVLYGILKWMTIGFLGRTTTPDEIFWEREAELHRPRDDRRPSLARTPAVAVELDGIDEVDDAEELEGDDEPVAVRSVTPRGSRREREVREGREGREGRRGSRDQRGPREGGRESREKRDRDRDREPREPRPPRPAREPREARELREPREVREPLESAESPELLDTAEATIAGADERPDTERGSSDANRARKRRRRRGGRGSRPAAGESAESGTEGGTDGRESDSASSDMSGGDLSARDMPGGDVPRRDMILGHTTGPVIPLAPSASSAPSMSPTPSAPSVAPAAQTPPAPPAPATPPAPSPTEPAE